MLCHTVISFFVFYRLFEAESLLYHHFCMSCTAGSEAAEFILCNCMNTLFKCVCFIHDSVTVISITDD